MEGTTKIFISVAVIFVVLLGAGIWIVRSGVFASAFIKPVQEIPFGTIYVNAIEQGMRREYVREVLPNGTESMEEKMIPVVTVLSPFSFAIGGKNFSYEVHDAIGLTAVRVPVNEQGLRFLVYADGHYAGSPYLVAWGDNHTLIVPVQPYPHMEGTFVPATMQPQQTQKIMFSINKTGWAESMGLCLDWTSNVIWATMEKAVVRCTGGWANTTGRIVNGQQEWYPNGLFRCSAQENRTAVCSAQQGEECVLSGQSIPKRLEKEVVKCFDLNIATPDTEVLLPLLVKTGDTTGADKVMVYIYDKEQYFVGGSRTFIREQKINGLWVDVGMPDMRMEITG